MVNGAQMSRRTFVGVGAVALASTALGFSGISLFGCSKEPSKPQSKAEEKPVDRMLSFKDSHFYIGSDITGVAYAGLMISLMPNVRNGTVDLAYIDQSGSNVTKEVAPLGSSILIKGECDTLTMDSSYVASSLLVDKAATIKALGVGTADQIQISGSVTHLVVLGDADVSLQEGSSVKEVSAAHPEADVVVSENADVGKMNVIDTDQLTVPKEDTTAVETLEPDAGPDLYDDILSDGQEPTEAQDDAEEAYEDAAVDGSEEDVEAEDEEAAPDPDPEMPEPEQDEEGDPIVPEVSEAEINALLIPDTAVPVAYTENQLITVGFSELVLDLLLKGLLYVGDKAAGKAVNYGMDSILGIFFGDSSQGVKRALDEIKSKLDETNRMVSQVIQMLNTLKCSMQIDAYLHDYSVKLRTGLIYLDGVRAEIDAVTDPTKRGQLQKQFANDILDNNDFKVMGEAAPKAALQLGNEILQVYAGTGANLFSAADQLMISRYKWEHFGYDFREALQAMVLSDFLSLTAYAEFALNYRIGTIKDDPGKSSEYITRCVQWSSLFGKGGLPPKTADNPVEVEFSPTENVVGSVRSMAVAKQVRRRPSSVRYFQVPGSEVLLTASASVVKTSRKAGHQQTQCFVDAAGHKVLTAGQLAAIHKSYGGAKTLTEILFSKDEGGIAPPSNTRLDFMGYTQPLKFSGVVGHINRPYYYAYSVTNKGVVEKMKMVSSGNSGVFDRSAIGVFRA